MRAAIACAAAILAAGCDLFEPNATAGIDGTWKFDAVQSCGTQTCQETHGTLVIAVNAGALIGTAHLTGEPGLEADTVLFAGYKDGAKIGFTVAACALDGTVYRATITTIRGSYHCGGIAGSWDASPAP